MTTMSNPMLSEFREEAAITKRVLDRVPADKLSWKPHPKSMSLGQLAIHIATVWRLMLKDKEIFTKPRISVLRSVMLNHWYHHRGQLSVYLRLLDVPVPVIYGRSADENPFA